MKHSNKGRGEFGVPRMALYPRHSWMIDVVSGLPSVGGYSSYLTMVDVFSGYVTCTALKNETSAQIAEVLEYSLIKPFGPPACISSDNAKNLQGPEVIKLCKFYNIKHYFTTPYTPESHGLVENQNRFLTQAMRIFSDQFKTTWYHVLPLAVITVNSVPRDSLKEHSPYFLMFGREFYGANEEIEKILDVDQYTTFLENNQIFFKLLKEYLLVLRRKRNIRRNLKVIPIPKGSLVYAKDFTKVPCKKAKAVYLRTPEKVIAEYATMVYTIDFLGKVHKRAKYNIKLATDRSLKLFGSLPLKIKMVLGVPMNIDIWEEIKNAKNLPEYMTSLENLDDDHLPMKTRSSLPRDSHILEKSADEPMVLEEPELLDISGVTFDRLQYLHENNLLKDPNMTLNNVDKLYHKEMKKRYQEPVVVPIDTPVSDLSENQELYYKEMVSDELVRESAENNPRKRQRILDEMLEENILKDRTRNKRRHVIIDSNPDIRTFVPEKSITPD
jgi:transposase InsO family protein